MVHFLSTFWNHRVLGKFDFKMDLMKLLTHTDSEVRKNALFSLQKLMSNKLFVFFFFQSPSLFFLSFHVFLCVYNNKQRVLWCVRCSSS